MKDLQDFFASSGDIDYRQSGKPTETTNPSMDYAIWLDAETFEKWICIDRTADANVWLSENGKRVPNNLEAVFGRIWNITDDVYKRIGLDQAQLDGFTLSEFDNWYSPSAPRVNDDDVSTPSSLTSYLDSSNDLPFKFMQRKVVTNTGVVTAFDHTTVPLSTEQIMTEIPKLHYLNFNFTSDGKEYQVIAVSLNAFSIDIADDLGFVYGGDINVWNPVTAISSGTVSGSIVTSAVHPAFIWHDGSEADFTYVGSFHSVSGRSTFGTGVKGTSSITLPTARTQHISFGANFNQHDFWNNSLVQLLAYIERGSNYLEQSGTKFDGYSWRTDSPTAYDQDNGLTLSLQNNTGVVLDGSNRVIANSYRGIENYHSALWQWVDGININDGACYLAKAGSTFASGTSASPYFDSGYVSTATASWQNIQKWNNGAFIPHASSGGSTSTKVTDQMYGNTGWRVLRFGGFLGSGGMSGLSCWLGDHDSSIAYWDIVSRASFRKFVA